MKILVTPTSFKPENKTAAFRQLEAFADEIVYNPYGRPLTEDELIPLLEGCDGFVAGLDFITEKVLKSCKGLRVISRYGAGYDRVDTAAAKTCGIPVTNTPGVNAQAVADLSMALILAAARRIPMLDAKTRDGQWVRSTGIEIYNKTMGILGLGAIGKNVAKRAQGFDMRVLAYDPYMDKDYAEKHDIQVCTFDEVITQADVLSLHLPLNDETRNSINIGSMREMKKGVIIVNTSRGGIIDEDAAAQMLKAGQLGGLGLDAFAQEPPEKSPLFELDNVVLTPHTGAHTKEATENMANAAVKNLIDVLSGNECPFVVNW